MQSPKSGQAAINHWVQLYLQAKLDGNKKLMDMYASLIIKLGGKPPK